MKLTEICNLIKKSFLLVFQVNKLYTISVVFSSLVLSIYPALNVFLLKKLINSIHISNNFDNKIINWIFFYSICSILYIIINQLNSYLTFLLNNRVSYNIQSMLLKKTDALSLSDFENSETYDIIKRADNQSEQAVYQYFSNVISIFSSLLSIVSNISLLIFWKSWLVVLILTISLLRSVGNMYFGKQAYNIQTKRTGKDRKKWYYGYLLKNDIAFKEIKIYKLHSFFYKKFQKIFNEFYEQDKLLTLKSTIFEFIISVINALLQIVIIVIGVNDVFHKRILIGDIVSYIQGGNNIKSSTDSFMTVLSGLVTSSLYLQQLFNFLDMPIDNSSNGTLLSLDSKIEVIHLKNVSFKYNDKSDYVLKNVNLLFESGNSYSIVGRNGTGKSTLIKILLGLYENYEGDIFINNINLRQINMDSYRKQIGVLFQDYIKYELTLKENINLNRNYSDTKVIEILKSLDSGLLEAMNLNQQLGFWFDEGLQLSGGQWIKIAISRSMIGKPNLLILDEANASLDNISEYKLLKTVNDFTIKDNIISISITHRLKNLKHFNTTIIYLKENKVCDTGNLSQLLKNKDFFKLYEKE